MKIRVEQDVADVLRKELSAGEKLLWTGRPKSFPLSFYAVAQVLFVLLWLSIVIGMFSADDFQEGGDLSTTPFIALPYFFIAAGLGFLGSAIIQLVGPSREVYGLTSERGIILRSFIWRRMASLSPETLKNFERVGSPSVGTLDFSAASGSDALRKLSLLDGLTKFHNIADPKAVEQIIFDTFSERPKT